MVGISLRDNTKFQIAKPERMFCKLFNFPINNTFILYVQLRLICISSRNVRRAEVVIFTYGWLVCLVLTKVIIEKSRGEGSLMEQDTIENVS